MAATLDRQVLVGDVTRSTPLEQIDCAEQGVARASRRGRHGSNAIEIHDPDTILSNQRQAARHVTRRGWRVTSRVVDGVNSH